MTLLQGSVGQVEGSTVTGPDGQVFVVMNLLGELASLVGTDSDIFQYWCDLCGSVWQVGLFNPNYFNPCGDPPDYACFNDAKLDQNATDSGFSSALCTIAAEWLISSVYNSYTGCAEKGTCQAS
jgi:hypothetical protein